MATLTELQAARQAAIGLVVHAGGLVQRCVKPDALETAFGPEAFGYDKQSAKIAAALGPKLQAAKPLIDAVAGTFPPNPKRYGAELVASTAHEAAATLARKVWNVIRAVSGQWTIDGDDYAADTGAVVEDWPRIRERLVADFVDIDGDLLAREVMAESDRAMPAKTARDGEKQPSDAAEIVLTLTDPKPDPNRWSYNVDFRCVNWYGQVFTFTAMQGACFEVLAEVYRAGVAELGEQTILEQVESSQSRLAGVFVDGKHPAWGTMIKPGSTKGTFRLAKPGE